MALRDRIVLGCAEGGTNQGVAASLGVNQATVGKVASSLRSRWHGRPLRRAPPPGAPRTITDDKVEEVIVKTLEGGTEGRHPLVDAVDC
jgi:hypothetical protein